MKLRDILGVLRDWYCRTIGIEYMHIQDPEQRKWFQERVELGYQKPGHDEQLRILSELTDAETFETFIRRSSWGQKRFGLKAANPHSAARWSSRTRGAGSTTSHRDGPPRPPQRDHQHHRKDRRQVFREFADSTPAPLRSGDVKYHLGTRARVDDLSEELGLPLPQSLPPRVRGRRALGLVRARQDRGPTGPSEAMPLVVHGDAAVAGQGVVRRCSMREVRGYRTGGTIHVVVNNQVGFTTVPEDARSIDYATDVAKTIQTPSST